MRYLTCLVLPLLLAACGTAQSPTGTTSDATAAGPTYDRLEQGQWQLSSTLGTVQGGAPGQSPQTSKQCVDKLAALKPVRETVLAMIDKDSCAVDRARFANGLIGGNLRCKGMDDIPEHDEAISGSYRGDRFSMVIDMPVYGTMTRQTIEARRIGDC